MQVFEPENTPIQIKEPASLLAASPMQDLDGSHDIRR